MDKDVRPIEPLDYMDPRCPLCEEPYGITPDVRSVPQQRIVEKLNEYMSRRDYAGAERHLLYWLKEAELGHDLRGQLLIQNELTGHYRKTGERDKAFASAAAALRLVDDLGFHGTVSSGTTYVNAATAYNAFGENGEALRLFEKARDVYENASFIGPELLGGLYNNMALVYAGMCRFPEAYAAYDKAMEAMGRVPGGGLEQAITCLNIANAVEDELGMEQGESRIYELLDKAYGLLDKPDRSVDEGYYAFVLEKCAPTFSYYGYFLAAEEFSERAKKIYERP